MEPVAEVQRIKGNCLRGRLPSWQRVVVMTTGEAGSRRAFVLKPGPEENEIRHGPFYVRGRFLIVEKANATKAADRLWDETETG